ncbi:MAG: tandem-95 repeat protein [Rhodoferax sp.]|nr:tandem-95 repeat protein [Rhodoferax sp.]
MVTAAGLHLHPNANFNGVTASPTPSPTPMATPQATVSLNVGLVDDCPWRWPTPLGVTEDTPFTASLASNDTPSGDGGNVWSKTTAAANGTVTVTAAGAFTYTPNANFNGVDSFTYTITDADGATIRATVSLNVGAVNDVPVAVADTPGASPRTRRLPPAWPPTTRPRAMAAMSGAWTTAAANGTVTGDRGRCFHTYTPNANFNGVDSFTYTITDADGATSRATVTLNVGAVDDVPVAVADTPVGVTEDTPFTASLACNDTPSGDGGNVWSKTTDPANGTVTVTAAGVFTYTPNANFNGVDSFTYTITDADGSTSSATVTLNVGAVDDVPVAVADTPVGVTEDTPFTASLASNDTPSGDGGNVWSKTTDPANGTVTGDRGRCFHIHPQRQLQWRGQLHLHHHRRGWLHLQRDRHPQCGRRR